MHRAIILIAVIVVTLLLDRVASFLDPLGSLLNFPSDLQRAVSCGMGQILVGVAIKTGCTCTLNGGGTDWIILATYHMVKYELL